jgi:hypothetical protein
MQAEAEEKEEVEEVESKEEKAVWRRCRNTGDGLGEGSTYVTYVVVESGSGAALGLGPKL